MGGSTRRRAVTLGVGLLVTLGLVLGSGWLSVRWLDRKQYVSQHKLDVALLTFPHSPHIGHVLPLSIEAYSEETPTARPTKCVPLVVTPTPVSSVTEIVAWSGTAGDPPLWVNFVTLRFHSAADARRALLIKRVALVRCRRISVSFPPFREVSGEYQVSDHSPVGLAGLSRVRYTLSGEKSYDFYARQYANTLTWTYGSADESSAARAQAVDDLVARLQDKELDGM